MKLKQNVIIMPEIQRRTSSLNPYFQLARLHKPIGILLIFIPGVLGLILANEHIPSFNEILFILTGSIVVRSLGCIINDMTDKKFDQRVERTKTRPLASGVLNYKQAALFCGVLATIAISLALSAPKIVWGLSFIAALLVLFYPWMKRITYWPQAFLGLAMNFSALIAYAYVSDDLSLEAYVLFGSLFFWTLYYDTVYAYQDIDDDLKIGVKSSAIALEKIATTSAGYRFCILCVTCLLLGLMSIGLNDAPLKLGPSLGFLIALGVFFFAQIGYFDPSNKPLCSKLFKHQSVAGLLMIAYLISLYF